MFSKKKKIKYMRAVGLTEAEFDEFIKRYTYYLKSQTITKNSVQNGFFILSDIQRRREKKKAILEKYISKNIYVIKYKREILKWYLEGNGYLKISNLLYAHHKVSVSKSTIARFIKDNDITREAEWQI